MNYWQKAITDKAVENRWNEIASASTNAKIIVEDTRWVFNKSRWAQRKTILQDMASVTDLKGKLALEPGALSGKFSFLFALENGCDVTILDYSYNAINLSRKLQDAVEKEAGRLLNTTYVQGDIMALPFFDNSFDIVHNSGVIEHWKDEKLRQKAITEMVRVAKHGGVVAIWVPNEDYILTNFLWRTGYFDKTIPEFPFSREELVEKMSKAGLHDIMIMFDEPEKSLFIHPPFIVKLKPFAVPLIFFRRHLLPGCLQRIIERKLSRFIVGLGRKKL